MEPVALIRLALQVLSDRLLILAGLAMACFLAGWVMYAPGWERVSALGIFCVLAYLVMPGKERKKDATDQATE